MIYVKIGDVPYSLKSPRNSECKLAHIYGMNKGKVFMSCVSGADPGFQVRGGVLKKIAPSGGRREKFWGISCEKSRFYAKKSYFFQF